MSISSSICLPASSVPTITSRWKCSLSTAGTVGTIHQIHDFPIDEVTLACFPNSVQCGMYRRLSSRSPKSMSAGPARAHFDDELDFETLQFASQEQQHSPQDFDDSSGPYTGDGVGSLVSVNPPSSWVTNAYSSTPRLSASVAHPARSTPEPLDGAGAGAKGALAAMSVILCTGRSTLEFGREFRINDHECSWVRSHNPVSV